VVLPLWIRFHRELQSFPTLRPAIGCRIHRDEGKNDGLLANQAELLVLSPNVDGQPILPTSHCQCIP
jgi:hypothetical protein